MDWTNLIGRLGDSAAGIIGALNPPRASAPATQPRTNSGSGLPSWALWAGGGLLVVVVLVFALKK